MTFELTMANVITLFALFFTVLAALLKAIAWQAEKRSNEKFSALQASIDALAKVAEFSPDLILLDVMMPKKSGFEVCEALRADPARSGLKIIMLTAKGRDTEMAKGLALGADAYMTKPFSTKDLIARIREVLAA